MGPGELIEKLCILNIKLFMACNAKADAVANPKAYSKEDLIRLMEKDIELCKGRGKLKSQIDKLIIGDAAVEEIKNYGS